MLLLSPEVYSKLKDEIEMTANQSIFDRAMKKILQNKDMSDSEKWYNYRNQLISFLNHNRKSRRTLDKETNLFLPHEHNVKQKSLRDNTTQTKLIFNDDMITQTSPGLAAKNFRNEEEEEVFEEPYEITPPRRSLSPAGKRRLSASGIAKTLKPPPKIQRTISAREKDYKIVTAEDGITQYTVPVDMTVDEASDLIEELEQVEKQKTVSKPSILRPSQLDSGQYALSFPVRKPVIRQSERLKTKKDRTKSTSDIAWERL